MLFDPEDKKNLPIIEYLSNKRVVIADPTRSLTTIAKKTFCDLGCKIQNIFVTDNLNDLEEIMRDKTPHFFLSTTLIETKSAVDFIDLHLKMHPDRGQSGFFIASENNSIASACAYLDEDIDALISYPLTIQGIQETILSSIKQKVFADSTLIEILKGKKALYSNDFLTAEQIFTIAVSKNSSSALALYYLGRVSELSGKLEDATEYYLNALDKDPKHYKSLRGLADIYTYKKDYENAYHTNTKILKNYPLNIKRLPELIRLSISFNKFEDIINYADIFTKVEDENPEIKRYVSAGLATCGKFLVKNGQTKEGVNALKKAADYSLQVPSIIDNICNTLFDTKLYRDAGDILTKAMEYNEDHPSYLTFNLKLMFTVEPAKSLLFGVNLLKKGLYGQEVFLYTIKAAIASKRNAEFIQDLIFEACKHHPQDKEIFENLQKDS